MSLVTQQVPSEFKTLPVQARIKYVQNLWDFIAETPERVPVPESHKQILDNRLAAFETEGDQSTSWRAVRDDILKNLGGD